MIGFGQGVKFYASDCWLGVGFYASVGCEKVEESC